MNHIKLHKGSFPDPEFYNYVGTYGNLKAYATRNVVDGIVKVKLVSMIPIKGANLFLNYNIGLGRFLFNEENKYFLKTYSSEATALDGDMEEYVRNLKDKEKVR